MGLVLCLLLANRRDLPKRFAALPLPFMTPRIREEIAGLGGSFLGGFTVLTSPSRFALTAAASVAAWLLELGMYWLIAEAFDLRASFITVAFAGSAANVSLSLPLAQGGVGAFEKVALDALVSFDIAKNAAAAYALALHFFLIVPVSLVGLVWLWRSAFAGAGAVAGNRAVGQSGKVVRDVAGPPEGVDWAASPLLPPDSSGGGDTVPT